MPQLYFTDLRALRRPAIVDSVSHELPFEIIATAATFGLVDGIHSSSAMTGATITI
jgi:hypothetical protein